LQLNGNKKWYCRTIYLFKFGSGLPDDFWHNQNGKNILNYQKLPNYQMVKKLPNGRKILEMAIFSIPRPFKHSQIVIYGMQVFHLATLVWSQLLVLGLTRNDSFKYFFLR
jgi:hypothetical protein